MTQNAKSLKKNTITNFLEVGYTTIIGIVMLPLYLQYLGEESFGLIGFFAVLQAWMQLLDMGMSPMLSRQAASARGHNIDFIELKKLVRSLEIIFFIIALIVVLSILVSSDWIANYWLKVELLSLTEVAFCITLMGIIIGLRFFSSLYSSGIMGMENQVLLNIVTIVLTTLKFVGVLLLLHFVTQEIVDFFIYQLILSMIELAVLSVMFYRLIPTKDKVGIGFFWDTLKPILPFATGITYVTVIWVFLTQIDKVILSKVLTLSEYGYFALVTVIAAGISQISGPISHAILPRMTYLLSQGKEKDMLTLYRKSTQFMAVIILPLSGMIAVFSTELLFAWTGDMKAAEWAGPILFWFVLGNGILAIVAFQYYLQFAHGKLRMHVIYNSVFASIEIPVMIYVAFEYGAMGVAKTWFVFMLISFIIWTPIVHNKFAPGIHWTWLFKDVAPIFVSTAAAILFFEGLDIGFAGMTRMEVFVVLISIGIVILMLNMLVSSASRELVKIYFRRYI